MQKDDELVARVIELISLHGTAVISTQLNVSSRTLSRWQKGETRIPKHIGFALDSIFGPGTNFVETKSETGEIRFIDLFAGIGGIRLGLENAGAKCVFTSEWDKFAVQTYAANFESGHQIRGDINKIAIDDLPSHEILAAGFPCQPFSLAGVSKKNSLGKSHGFLDETQGTLFFNIAQIIAEKRPKAFLLENVKNLISHDKGRTFNVILRTLVELGYNVTYRVIDARAFVPQHRERIYIVGFLDETTFSFKNLEIDPTTGPRLSSILHSTEIDHTVHPLDGHRFFDSITNEVNDKYTLSDKLWMYLQGYAEKHRAAGNGFGYGLVQPDSTSRTLSARYHKDGSEILIHQGEGRNPRRLTPRECARLMGFPETFQIPVSDTQAYRQFGNSVAVPVIEMISREIVSALR